MGARSMTTSTRSRRYPVGRVAMLLAPPVIFVVALFAVPIFKILLWSFENKETGVFTFSNYTYLLTQRTYVLIIANTFRTSLIVTIATLILGYPVAFVLARLPVGLSNLLMLFVLLPLWTSILVRTYAWTVIFQRAGPLNGVLLFFGLVQEPLSLGHSTFGVTVGMTHFLLPFMILPLYSVIRRIDFNLVRAAHGLGAGPFRVFRRIVLPLSMSGIVAGSVLVFILSIGSFITPALLGGREDTFIAQLIEQQANTLLNWNLAAALAITLLVIAFGLIIGAERAFGVTRVWRLS
jgi:putative spermidine/putrescine transport system permease protein